MIKLSEPSVTSTYQVGKHPQEVLPG